MAFNTSGELTNLLKRQLGLDEKTYAVLKIWEKEMGPQMKYARLSGVKKGTLMVEVDSSVHLQELVLRRRELIKKINQHFGGEKVVRGMQVKLKK